VTVDEKIPSRWRSFWRGSRRAWRWTRWMLWGALLLLMAAAAFLHYAGLPDFLKERLLAGLRRRGVPLEFSRLYLHPVRGLVAENLQMGSGDESTVPWLQVSSADIGLDLAALGSLELKVDSLLLRGGRVRWPLTGTNQPPRRIEVDRLTTGIYFRADDQWELHHLRAHLAGLEISANGSIAQASWLGALNPPRTNGLARAQLEHQLHGWLARLDRMQFSKPPDLRLNFTVDARTGRLDAEFSADAPRIESPWGASRAAGLHLHLTRAAGTNVPLRLTAECNLTDARTQWGRAQGTKVRLKGLLGEGGPMQVEYAVSAMGIHTPWGAARSLTIAGDATRAGLTNAPIFFTGTGEGTGFRGGWGVAERARIEFTQAANAEGTIRRTARVRMDGIVTPEGEADEADLSGLWPDTTRARILVTGRLEKPRWPHGRIGRAQFSLEITNAVPWSATATAAVSDLVVAQIHAPQVSLTAALHPAKDTNLVTVAWSLLAGALESEGARATNAALRGQGDWILHEKRPLAQAVNGRIGQIVVRSGEATQIEFTAEITPPAGQFIHKADASWGPWRPLEPVGVAAELRAQTLRAQNLEAEKIVARIRWDAPALAIEKLEAALCGGTFAATGRVQVASRQAMVQLKSDMDPHQLAPRLGTNIVHWLRPFVWEKSPRIEVRAQMTLPAWTNAAPQWLEEWKRVGVPSLDLTGGVAVGRAQYRGVPVESAATGIVIRERVLQLPELQLVRPEGRLTVGYTGRLAAGKHQWRVRGVVDPAVARPLLDEATRRVFDQFQFRTPLAVEGEMHGQWRVPEATGLRARVATTNLVFKGESFSNVSAAIVFTNRVLTATEVRVARGDEEVRVARVAVDWRGDRITIEQAESTMDPLLVTGLIGASTRRAIEPYRFAKPPVARVNGSLPISNSERTDLTFELRGGPFQWEPFRLADVNATVHWVTNRVILTNVVGGFYGGRLAGQARFDVGRADRTGFQFDLAVENADLNKLLKDVSSPTNQVLGRFDGRLVITEANTADARSWRGFGNATLRDGLLWDVGPVGVLIPRLEGTLLNIVRSQAKSAGATFAITNSVIHTRDLEIRTGQTQLRFDGQIGFDQKVDMKVAAVLLPKMGEISADWLFGSTLGRVTRLFEFHITGTLDQPKAKPVVDIKKPWTLPLLPWKLLLDLKDRIPEKKPEPEK
jgi:hypothetical protein